MDQETYDEVSGLELRDVMEQAVEQGVDFNGMEPGEITTIKAMARTAGVGSQQVTIEKVQYTDMQTTGLEHILQSRIIFLMEV